jgi:hypothetical protein
MWRAREIARRVFAGNKTQHLVFVIANHFEPAWNGTLRGLDLRSQMARLDKWHEEAQITAREVVDCDGAPFRHTYFYPAEQYHWPVLDHLAWMQSEGLGEVEVHLHHGVDEPDNASNLRRTLVEFRDALAAEHKLLSEEAAGGTPRYAFVHGNWALANAAGGPFCGVDSEMQILADTGCYADLTMPAIGSPAQVSRINAVYQCGYDLAQRAPHRSGPDLRVGRKAALPIIVTGPTVLDWRRRRRHLPVPRVDDGVLTASYPLDLVRLRHWRSAAVSLRGRPEWIFIKLHCHGFYQQDQPETIGEPVRRFMSQVLELSEKSDAFRVHFACAREVFNIITAGLAEQPGAPGQYRDYRLQPIMRDVVRSISARAGALAAQERPGIPC